MTPEQQTSSRTRISTLPQAVADRIAAGEVVERPASVVKELVENALDAGADRVTIAIEDAGRTLIKVTDNGAGMTATELAAAIGRHSTSKLRRFEDLESLHTFGFRGEALPSIAAVSRMEIVSCVAGEDVGTSLKVSGGRVDACEPTAAPQGTSVAVGHLFYNVPARRKFLRTDTTEFKWIASVFRHFALSHPDVGWELFRGRQPVYQLASGDPRSRIAALFGDDVAEEMLEINQRHGWLNVRGWISPPSLTQRTREDQFLFVNRRSIQSPRLNRAVYTAMEPYLVSGGHPIYIILLEADPDRFDINVHPAKKEVKFADERSVNGALWAAVRSALGNAGRESAGKPLPDEPQGRFSERPGGRTVERVPVDAPAHLTPFVSVPRHHGSPRGAPLPFPRDHGDAGAQTERESRIFDPEPVQPARMTPGAADGEGPVIWQVFDTYLVSPLTTGLVFVDQHVAHERILFERALNAIDNEPWTSQQLLFPVSFGVRQEDVAVVEECLPLLRAMGFEIDTVGPREFRIMSAPAGVRIANEREMIQGLLEDFRENTPTASDPRHRLAASFACRGAVKAGQPLEAAEMQRLIDELFQTQDPEFCPHGRPIYHVLNRREIDKWFKR